MDNMPPLSATGNPADVATRHLFTWHDAHGDGWGVGRTPEEATTRGHQRIREAVENGDGSGRAFDEQSADGFVVEVLLDASPRGAARVVASLLSLRELEVLPLLAAA